MIHSNTQPFELPNDVAALRELVTSLRTQVTSSRAQVSTLQERVQFLEHNVEVLRKLVFGPRSEKRTEADLPPQELENGLCQGHLFLAQLAADAERAAAELGATSSLELVRDEKPKAKKGRRKHFPSDAPVVRTTYELPEDERKCACGGELHPIGEECTRELERVELSVIHEIVRIKYACRTCEEGVQVAPAPARPIPKGLLGPGFLAHLIVERFLNHMPYHRQEKKYASEGLDLSRSVLCASAIRCAELLSPIANLLREEVVASDVIHTDDTPVRTLQMAGAHKNGRVWVYLNRDGKHWYDFTESRKRDGPLAVLGDFQGWIHADAYPGYDRLYLPGKATEVACWAHARRKFVEAEVSEPEFAKEAIDRIRRLYAIESEAEELTPMERFELRNSKSKPILAELRAWLELVESKVLPKGSMASAIRYTLEQWTALCRFLEDGRLAIDNNAAERALRPFALGRKNWLYFQNEMGGRTATILMSLLMTAKAAEVHLRDYFRDVLLRMAKGEDPKTLTPHAWKEKYEAELQSHRASILARLFARPQHQSGTTAATA